MCKKEIISQQLVFIIHSHLFPASFIVYYSLKIRYAWLFCRIKFHLSASPTLPTNNLRCYSCNCTFRILNPESQQRAARRRARVRCLGRQTRLRMKSVSRANKYSSSTAGCQLRSNDPYQIRIVRGINARRVKIYSLITRDSIDKFYRMLLPNIKLLILI
ncbi:hypothetical protein PUN28_003938 [Cardiocondyla obscurior]|uniref:Uncharacterized protein n=1 Tax=Cardiocondyla obscurior TaxID=286306 RepID=A0AAW2GPE4_9HYME